MFFLDDTPYKCRIGGLVTGSGETGTRLVTGDGKGSDLVRSRHQPGSSIDTRCQIVYHSVLRIIIIFKRIDDGLQLALFTLVFRKHLIMFHKKDSF